MFLSIWLHSKKSFGKYFHVFFCVLENALENTFSINFSHFSQLSKKYYNKKSQYINPKKQKKKKKNLNSANPTLDLDRERERDLREKIEG